MRRVIALVAAALLALALAGPVAADPVPNEQFPHEYVTTCEDGTLVPDQMGHQVPGWDLNWEPGSRPWLLMGYIVHYADGSTYVGRAGLLGLQVNGRLIGPCTITWGVAYPYITDAYYMQR